MIIRRSLFPAAGMLSLLLSFSTRYAGVNEAAPDYPDRANKFEQGDGWRPLFDGQTTKGWHKYGGGAAGSAWKAANGELMLQVQKTQDGHWQAEAGGDIVTDEEFENFELELEWKIAPCGNSGIMFYIVEDPKYRYPWETGPEMQVLDNTCHPDAKIIKHRAGDLYDMVSSKQETVKRAGDWNQVRLVVNKGKIEQWLNGVKVVEIKMGTGKWDKLVAGSKWKNHPDYAKVHKGRIGLQDHGNEVSFRNIRIREL